MRSSIIFTILFKEFDPNKEMRQSSTTYNCKWWVCLYLSVLLPNGQNALNCLQHYGRIKMFAGNLFENVGSSHLITHQSSNAIRLGQIAWGENGKGTHSFEIWIWGNIVYTYTSTIHICLCLVIHYHYAKRESLLVVMQKVQMGNECTSKKILIWMEWAKCFVL
jgi:hypothetical protein